MTEAALRGHDRLTDLLHGWLPRQRWYAGKGTSIASIDVIADEVLRADEPRLHHVVVLVDTTGGHDRYQLLIGLRGRPPERLEHAVIGQLEDGVAYDAVHDTDLTAVLLTNIVENRTAGAVRFVAEPGAVLDPRQPSRVSLAEQSNTSLVFGSAYILKLFRRVSPGINPDLELHRALAAVGSPHIAPPYGAIEGKLDGDQVTYGMLQAYVANAADGWQMATTSVRDLYAEADLRADEVGGDFAGEAYRLGQATAELHADLASALGERLVGPDESQSTAALMRDRLAAGLAAVPELAPYAGALTAAFDEVGALTEPVRIQRIHGDFHLGQVLRSMNNWIVLDFEGEPARPLAERTSAMSPLRDVAGMLRSFDYAARHLLADHPGDVQRDYRATEWAERNREAFCDGYAAAAGEDPRKHTTLLRGFELEKAVYEVVYEARNRPTWLPIPLGSIARLVS